MKFEHDQRDAYQKCNMQALLETTIEELRVENLPLLKDSLVSSPWNKFEVRPFLFYEQFCRKTFKQWITHEQLHNEAIGI